MRKQNRYTISFFAVLVMAVVCIVYKQAEVSLAPGKGFGKYTYTSKDSSLIMERHMGYINYDRFIQLTKNKLPKDTLNNVTIRGDSVFFKTRTPHYFFGQNDRWTKQYKNLPIHITADGFNAKLATFDSIRYIFLPYQILANLAKMGESADAWDEGEDDEPRTTIRDVNDLPLVDNTKGNKIQTEGNVRKNVVDILSNHQHCSRREQMEVLWNYAKGHWNYMNDPFSTKDTWRPASETIDDYYFVNGKCYTGDCDDFAILMASFARQLGYDSHIIVAIGKDGGHAYAEFYDNGKWIPLDWFSNGFGGKPYEASIKKIIDNI